MHTLIQLENPNQFADSMKRRFTKVDIQEILDLDEKKRNITFVLQELQNKRNNYSKSIVLIKDNKEERKIVTKVNELKK